MVQAHSTELVRDSKQIEKSWEMENVIKTNMTFSYRIFLYSRVMNIGRNILLRLTTKIEADSRTLNLVATYTPNAYYV